MYRCTHTSQKIRIADINHIRTASVYPYVRAIVNSYRNQPGCN